MAKGANEVAADNPPEGMTRHPETVANWPRAAELNRLAEEWMRGHAPQAKIVDRSGWQGRGRTQYVVLEENVSTEDGEPGKLRYAAVINVTHSKGNLYWKIEEDSQNPKDANCPVRIIKALTEHPPRNWEADTWRGRARREARNTAMTRKLMRELRRNYPKGDSRIVVNGKGIMQYAEGIYRRKSRAGYWDPDERMIIRLEEHDIDIEATLALRDDALD